MSEKLYKVRLHGFLEKQFSKEITEVYGTSLKDIFSCLCHRYGEKFRRTILEGSWHITVGKRKSNKLKPTDNFISEDMVDFPVAYEEIHVFPVVQGAGRGVGQIILGVVLIVVAIVAWYLAPAIAGVIGGTAAGVASAAVSIGIAGAASLAGGIATSLSGSAKIDYSAAADKRQSFLYNGAINNTEQGVPVPLVYGRHMTGSTIISAAIDVEQISAY